MTGEAGGKLRRTLGTWDLTLLAVVAVVNLNVVPVIAANGRGTVWLWLAALLFFFLPQGVALIELAKICGTENGRMEGSRVIWHSRNCNKSDRSSGNLWEVPR